MIERTIYGVLGFGIGLSLVAAYLAFRDEVKIDWNRWFVYVILGGLVLLGLLGMSYCWFYAGGCLA